MKIVAGKGRVAKKLVMAIIGVAVALACQMPAMAVDDKEQSTVSEIVSLMTDKAAMAKRGGDAKQKSLGFYTDGMSVTFKSAYPLVSAKKMAEWAYDLHQFVLSKGGGYANIAKYTKEHPKDPSKWVDPVLSEAKPDPWDPEARAHVSYADQKKFAEKWWSESYADYRDTMSPKDWWLNDAILDGNNLWYAYEVNTQRVSAENVLWIHDELAKLFQKK